jgi:signal transduction histidine kinase
LDADKDDPLDYRRRLLLPGVFLTVVEAMVVLAPLSTFVAFTKAQVAVLKWAAPLMAVAALALYLPLWRLAMAPIDRCILHKRRGEPISQEDASAAYLTILRAPLLVVSLRTSAWIVLIGGVVLVLRLTAGFSEIPVVITIATLHTFAVSTLRGFFYARVLRDLRAEILPNIDPLKLFGDTYMQRAIEVAVITGAIGIGAIALFVYYFIPIGMEAYKALEAYFAPTVMGLTLLWYFWVRRMPTAMAQYLAKRDDASAIPAYREAQALPFKLAGAKIVFWLVAALALALQGWAFGVDPDAALLMFAAVIILIIGVAQFEVLWQRQILRRLLQHLSGRHRLPLGELASRLGIRAKMLGGFGSLLFFTCGLSMLWSFVQYQKFVGSTVRTQAEAELGRAQADLIRRGAKTQADVVAYLQTRNDSVLEYAPPGNRPVGKPAPASVRLSLGPAHDLGILLARPPARTGTTRQLEELGAFFLALLGLSLGLILILVRDLTEPVRQLEERAVEMARGELARPVVATGDADEIGRLTFAFEEVRRFMRDKLRSTESLSVALEREVMRRTEDLEHTNRELRDTLESLKRAQDELLRSEKLASMGRLVAGIAHEINNPINAMVNTLSPLEESLRDRLGGSVPGDVREMMEVIQRGAARTKAIVQALHSYSRGDTERKSEVDLHRGLDESLELLRHHLKQGIAVERRYGQVGRVQGYAGQLQQVFMNLLTNAAQAMSGRADGAAPDGTGHITIETSRVGKDVVIKIVDNGPGIPTDVLPRIFDPFFTTKEVGKGSGLGLSIVHGIVERHGGRIDVDSQLGGGTTFTVTLPQDTVA